VDDFENEIKREFINEALMNLEETESSFMELESTTAPKPLLEKIFRMAHNLKGGSRAVGFTDVAEFTHQLENLVLKIQQNALELNSHTITILLQANDRLVEMLVKTKADFNVTFNNSDLLKIMKDCIESGGAAPSLAERPPAPAEIPPVMESSPAAEISSASRIPEEVIPEPVALPVPTRPVEAAVAPTPAPASAPGGGQKEDETVRVNMSRIDSLNNFVGELIVLQSMIQQIHGVNYSPKLESSLRQMAKISKDIQGLSMSLRMLPVKPLVQKLQRVVRDTALSLGKEVTFQVIGEQIDIDKSVLDRLADPLIHILRNAVDHGLESTRDRLAAGKPAAGKVILSFSNEGNSLLVEVRDDGQGIHSDRIRAKAIEKGIVGAQQILTERQTIQLIFHAGFSTKAETTEISGRGVGMDVVKTNVEKIGGTIDISTKVGGGSVFRMDIPLSLAVIDGWIVTTATNRYVVPVSQVVETVSLGNQKLFQGQGIGACIDLRGTVIPLFDLESTLLGKRSNVTKSDIALITMVDDRLVGMTVSDIVRSQQIVVKPTELGIPAQKGWIGSCVLGDGMATLIVSIKDLLEGKTTLSRGAVGEQRSA
jgi:two-component system chemotaxis sensor kinase CheA